MYAVSSPLFPTPVTLHQEYPVLFWALQDQKYSDVLEQATAESHQDTKRIALHYVLQEAERTGFAHP